MTHCVIRRCLLTPEEHGRYACLRCTEGIRKHLRQIEGYAGLLELMPTLLALPGRADTGRRSPGYASTPPPGLLDSLDALNPGANCSAEDPSLLWRLDSVCRLVLEERQDAGESEPHESYATTLCGAITYLLWTAEWTAHQPWVDDHASGIATIHAQARGMAHDQPPDKIAGCLRVDCSGEVHWTRDQWVSDGNGTRKLDCGRCRTCGELYYGTRLVRLRSQVSV